MTNPRDEREQAELDGICVEALIEEGAMVFGQ